MTVVDSSIWIRHIQSRNPVLDVYTRKRTAMIHPMVLGELACGMFARREERFRLWHGLPRIDEHPHSVVIDWIESERLMGRGIGFIDAHLLYSTLSRPGTRLWTFDKRLGALAAQFGVEHPSLN